MRVECWIKEDQCSFRPAVEQRNRAAVMVGLHQSSPVLFNLYTPLGLGGDSAPSGGLKISWGLIDEHGKNGARDRQMSPCSIDSDADLALVFCGESKGKALDNFCPSPVVTSCS